MTSRGFLSLAARALMVLGCGVAAGCASSSPPTTTVQDLRRWEQTACAGVPEPERDHNPFADPELIESVTESRSTERKHKLAFERLLGAEITMRATPRTTRSWLTRVLRCHAARHATTLLPDRDDDPLAVGRPQISVLEREGSLAITIRTDDDEAAREILRRALRLAPKQP